MVSIGYTMMGEQRAPRQLIYDAVLAEKVGVDFAVISDHYHPWVEAQRHAPFTWSVLGAAAQATERLSFTTYVTCPILRYHPALVAQMAATMGLLAEGRFRLGLGAGEELNENVVGKGWPAVDVRHEMLVEAVEIIRRLWDGGYVNHHGEYYDVESAKLFDRPEPAPPLGIAVSGQESCGLAGATADFMVSTEPKAELVQMFGAAGGQGKPVVGQIAVCWGEDEATCRTMAHQQFGWSLGGWKIQSELPNVPNFEAFVAAVSEDAVTEKVPCGPDTDKIVASVKEFFDAGFTEVALVQIGPEQAAFCNLFERELAAKLRAL